MIDLLNGKLFVQGLKNLSNVMGTIFKYTQPTPAKPGEEGESKSMKDVLSGVLASFTQMLHPFGNSAISPGLNLGTGFLGGLVPAANGTTIGKMEIHVHTDKKNDRGIAEQIYDVFKNTLERTNNQLNNQGH
jgi:hypothetical protein